MSILAENLPSHRSVRSGPDKILLTGGKGNFAVPVSRDLAGCGDLDRCVTAGGNDRDGLKATHFMQKDVVRKWCLGARITGQDRLLSGTVLSSGADHYYPHFARLCRQIDDFFLTGRSPVPLSRICTTRSKLVLAGESFSTLRVSGESEFSRVPEGGIFSCIIRSLR